MDEQSKPSNIKKIDYVDQYAPELLEAVNRDINRKSAAINLHDLPFQGVDIWNNFDFTWLNRQGIAEYGMLSIYVPCNSSNTIESKSLKLYLYSFANSQFQNMNEIVQTLQQDLSKLTSSTVQIRLEKQLPEFMQVAAHFTGTNLDNDPVNCSAYALNADFLQCDPSQVVSEQLCSDLLQIISPSGKPDWASVRISYTGPKIDHSALLKYIISYRKQPALPEHCIEHFYYNLLQFCKPSALTIEGAFTRRGSIDIYPIRSTDVVKLQCSRLFRQ